MSIFPRPLKRVLGKIIPFSKEDKIPTFNLGSGTADNTTFLRGDGTWASPGSSGYVPYVGATQDVNLGDYKITADAVAFDLNPVNAPGAGQIAYDGASGALAYLLNNSNVISRIGQTMHAYVHNAEAVTITKGQAVYLYQASGNKASVKLAYNTSDATSAKTFGLAAENIGAGQNGMVICQGVLDGLNTGMYSAGDTLYLGATAGTYTNVKPYAPNHFVYIGIVERANAGNGQIYVRVQNGYEMDELHDVDLITTPPVNGNVLTYNGSLWVPQSPATGITVGTTPVTSGTDGRVFFQSGGVVQQDSSLFWDNTNKRLGISTSSPVRTLDLVNGDFRAAGMTFTINGAQRVINTHSDTGTLVLSSGVLGGSSNVPRIELRGGGTTALMSNNLERITILNTGFVGVGAPSPQARLDVRAQGALSTDLILRTRNSADTRNFLVVNGAGDVFNNGAGGVTGNTFYGENVGRNSSGSSNTGIGREAASSLTTALSNTAIGSRASFRVTTGDYNTSVGASSLIFNIIGFSNTAVGFESLFNTTSNSNTGIGTAALKANTTGEGNVAVGEYSLLNKVTGNSNVAVGNSSGRHLSDGVTALTAATNSIFIGNGARSSIDSQTNQIVIGHNAIGTGSNSVTLGNTSITRTNLRGQVVISGFAAAPVGIEGAIYYDSTTKKHYGFDGTNWNALY